MDHDEEDNPESPGCAASGSARSWSASHNTAQPVCLEAAMEAWGDTVLRLATSRLHNTSDAEDVFQTVFLRLHQANKQFVSGEHLKAWLLRVTINCCNDICRNPWHKQRATFDEAAANNSATQTDHYPNLHLAQATHETQLIDALAHLSEQQRTAIHLFYFEDYSTDEISQITGENPATVRSHLHRARQTLKRVLGVNL